MANIQKDFDNIGSSIYADILNDYDKCRVDENNFDVITPTLILTIPCGLSFFVE